MISMNIFRSVSISLSSGMGETLTPEVVRQIQIHRGYRQITVSRIQHELQSPARRIRLISESIIME